MNHGNLQKILFASRIKTSVIRDRSGGAAKNRIISFVVFTCILLSSFTCFAEGDTMGLSCPSALLMEQSTGEILYEKDIHSKRPLASVTKIMTMLLAMEAIDAGKFTYDDMITGSAHAKSMGGSTIFLDEGEQLSVRDILKGIAVASGNDAAVAMAEHIAGSEDNFVAMMNERAKQLGMNNTNFVNSNGLPADNHYSTAYDIALMSRELMKHEDIFDYTTIWMDSLRNGEFTLSNTNKLIRFYEGATGLKTGSTDEAKFCISATAKRNGMHLIAVIMAAPTSKERQKDASTLLNYGFSNYALHTCASKGESVDNIHIAKSASDTTEILCGEDAAYLYEKSTSPEISREIILNENMQPPYKAGEAAGKMIIKNADKEIAKVPLVFATDVDKLSLFGTFGKLLDNWVQI